MPKVTHYFYLLKHRHHKLMWRILIVHFRSTTPYLLHCFQIDPNSIAAKDGRIREGDRIIQVKP